MVKYPPEFTPGEWQILGKAAELLYASRLTEIGLMDFANHPYFDAKDFITLRKKLVLAYGQALVKKYTEDTQLAELQEPMRGSVMYCGQALNCDLQYWIADRGNEYDGAVVQIEEVPISGPLVCRLLATGKLVLVDFHHMHPVNF